MNIQKTIRSQFPIFRQKIGNYPLVFLNNASTTQKPEVVINAIADYYRTSNSNINRAAHSLASRSEHIVEKVRNKVAKWIHASTPEEIIFTAGTTASINLITHAYAAQHLQKGDEIIVSSMEHLSNWLPWYMLAKEKGALLKTIPTTPQGKIDQEAYQALLSTKTKIVALTHVSNVLGTVNPIKEMTAKAHKKGAIVIVDAAQSIPHLPIDVMDIDCDFLVFSSHKIYGPTGLGILYANKKMHKAMIPWQLGGGVLRSLQKTKNIYEPIPHMFEAGTLHLAGIAGLGAALTFLEHISYPLIKSHEQALLSYTIHKLKTVPGIKLWGEPTQRIGIISFTIGQIHPLDIGIKLDTMGIAVRTGKHCAIPLMRDLDIEGTVRISIALYNTREDIDRLTDALFDLIETL